MKKINRLKRYFLSALVLSLASIALHSVSVIFNIFISNKIGTEGMGLVTLTSGVYSFALTFATSGINFAVVRLISGALPYDEDSTLLDKKSDRLVKKIMAHAFLYCLFFSSLASLTLFCGAGVIGEHVLDDLRVVPSLKIMALSLVPISLSSAINGYFYAVRRVYKNVIVQFCEQGVKITVISSLLIFIFPSQISYACFAIALGGLVSELSSASINAVLYILDRKKHKKTITERVVFCSNPSKLGEGVSDFSAPSVFGSAFPVAVSAYARSFLNTIEHLAIPWGLKKSGMGASGALASYGVLCGMVFPLIFFPSSVLGAFSSLLVPEIASSYEAKDYKRIKNIVSRVFGFSLIFSVCVSGVFICFSYEIGAYFFNTSEAGTFIRLLAPLIPIMYLDSAVDAILKGLGEQIYTMRINIIDSLISVLLVLILLPNMGIYGYIVVIFVTEMFNTAFSIIRLLNKTKIKPNILKWIFKPILSIVSATIISRLLFDVILPFAFGASLSGKLILIFEIAVCAVLYIVFSKISGSISEDEINIAKRILSKNQ